MPPKDTTDDFVVEEDNTTTAPLQETDSHRIAQRLKQIKLGKNTLGYQAYLDKVPKDKREKHEARHPNTPNVHRVCSKRQFDGLLKSWRRALHTWDPRTVEQRRADTGVTHMDGNKRKEREEEVAILMDWTLTGDGGVSDISKKSRTGKTPEGKGGKEQQQQQHYQEVDYEDDDDDLDNIGV